MSHRKWRGSHRISISCASNLRGSILFSLKMGANMSFLRKVTLFAVGGLRRPTGCVAGAHITSPFLGRSAQAAAFDAAKHFNTPAELLDRAFNRPTVTQLREQASVPATAGTEAAMRKRAAKPPSGYRELVARTNRLKTLTSALDAAEAEKANMGKGRKRKVAEALRPKLGQLGLDGQPEDGDGGRGAKQPAVFKWKTERKR